MLHSVFCLIGSVVLGIAVSAAIGIVSRGAAKATELAVPAIVSAVLALFAAPRWLRGSAPWVGLFGLAALFVGWQGLYQGWSPAWSHQTRKDYILAQLFGIGGSCSDSECLYLLFFGLPFLCLMTYGLISLIALGLTRKTPAQ